MNTFETELPYPVNAFFDRLLLVRAKPFLLHSMFGQSRPLSKRQGNTIKFRRYEALAPATTALTPGVTPTGSTLQVTDVTAVISQYGNYIVIDDFTTDTSLEDVWMASSDVLGQNAGETIDIITRNVLLTCTNVRYADATSPKTNDERSDIAAADVLAADELRLVVNTLKNANAQPITQMLPASTGIDTSPVNRAFIGIVHPNVEADLKAISGFQTVEHYSQTTDLYPGEFGKFEEIRFLSTTQAVKHEDAGAGGAVDVYVSIFLAKNAFGVTELDGMGMQNIRKAFGSEGSGDPLNQRASVGWKSDYTAEILNDEFMVLLEHASTMNG